MASGNFEDYWAKRHESHAGKLSSVGHISATEDKNTQSYAIKKRNLVDVLRAIGTVDLRGKSVLDAGCGIGLLSEVLYALGADVSGVDISPIAIEQAQLRCPTGSFQASSLTSFDFGRTFDIVICADVLYHLVDDDAWRSALRVFAQHSHGPIAILDQLKGVVSSPAPHVKYRTINMYREAFAEIGLHQHPAKTSSFVVFTY